MTGRVSSKNKEKKAKRKNSVSKKRPLTEKQNGTKKQKQRRWEPNPVYLHVQATL